jgi:hypothetical protein
MNRRGFLKRLGLGAAAAATPIAAPVSAKPEVVERVVEVEVTPEYEQVTLGESWQYTVLPDGRIVTLNHKGEGAKLGFHEEEPPKRPDSFPRFGSSIFDHPATGRIE